MASWKAFQANLLIHIHVKPLQPILHTNHPPLKVMAKVSMDSALWKNSVVGNSVCSVTPGTLASPSLKIRSMKPECCRTKRLPFLRYSKPQSVLSLNLDHGRLVIVPFY
uniref:Uncharacterized protein n=10 Tax=Solanum TaxID=4107 RepID=A0A3G1ND24_SOLTU|nr:hypothetical protein [Solanum tuberosum]QPF97061.1 hypothetical protein [Solanum stenotomum subsp. goniocalyx]QPF97200.1 hypothetical protein [Solanum ahanhuiri]QPF97240.1 hypothetical protein [Solanum phureja]QPF97307.1 hypothetical protein [Solanum stenotomum subsp. stenotomum]QPF97374.1 hypothetical protein [Solanum bukasovii]QPF97441.1 hypothetical protein [Solanum tuberosum subsp. andigenum]QPF97582.1 hypothetical protein [Solanum x juzepczukii]QPF97654.1 hypothetical protein [Solan